MIKSFHDFIFESSMDSKADQLAERIVRLIKLTSGKIGQETHNLSVSSPVNFRLTLLINRTPDFFSDSNPDLRNLPWEIFNFRDHGFAIDANTVILDGAADLTLTITINPEKEHIVYPSLYFGILEAIRHEFEHLVKGHESSFERSKRAAAQFSHEYFLLPDEIGPMVNGLALAAREKGIPATDEFLTYLMPFVRSGFMSKADLNKILNAWNHYSGDNS